MTTDKIVIALYLPQFHPFPENDLWWGKGFTEWTNVCKAKPLFKGHDQPKIPSDLGYYDLRLPESRMLQADYAKRAGVNGFCYYHYWFGDKELMKRPFDEVVSSGEPDFPFCLCWANESWHNKFWNMDGTWSSKILIEQKYIGKEDNEKHFYRLLNAFKDHRYMTCDGRLIFMIYSPLTFIGLQSFMDQWQCLAQKNGLKGFYFIGYATDNATYKKILELGFDAVNITRINQCYPKFSCLQDIKRRIISKFIGRKPVIIQYKDAIEIMDDELDDNERIIPSIVPNWDHTPRSGKSGFLFQDVTPELFRTHVRKVLTHVSKKKNKMVFIKSWNEWGEGNYMEPDMKYGTQFIDILSEELVRE